MAKGPWLILHTERGEYFSAEPEARRARPHWTYRLNEASEYATRGDAERVVREKFSALTRGDIIVIRREAPKIPGAQRSIAFAEASL
jgi:hypothetical protein